MVLNRVDLKLNSSTVTTFSKAGIKCAALQSQFIITLKCTVLIILLSKNITHSEMCILQMKNLRKAFICFYI